METRRLAAARGLASCALYGLGKGMGKPTLKAIE